MHKYNFFVKLFIWTQVYDLQQMGSAKWACHLEPYPIIKCIVRKRFKDSQTFESQAKELEVCPTDSN